MKKATRFLMRMSEGKNTYVVAIKWTHKATEEITFLTQNTVRANKPETAIKKCIDWYGTGKALENMYIKVEDHDIRITQVNQ